MRRIGQRASCAEHGSRMQNNAIAIAAGDGFSEPGAYSCHSLRDRSWFAFAAAVNDQIHGRHQEHGDDDGERRGRR